MSDNKYEVVPEESPDRCQAVHPKGQCRYKQVAGAAYCPMHGGNKGAESKNAKSLSNYRLSKWQLRVDEFAGHDKVKSLREEIGILRILLEETVNKCSDTVDLVLNSSKIADLVAKIEKLVVSCHRLESNLGLMLDKQAAMQLASEFVEIIGRHVKDEEALSLISNDVGDLFIRLGKPGA